MNDFDVLDADEQALMKKPRPVGWFVSGAIAVASLGFVFAFYMPLSSAHDTLLENHEKLAKKSHELDHALKTKTQALTSTEERRANLERFVSAAGDQEKSLHTKFEIAHATAQNELKAFTKAKMLQTAVGDAGVELQYSEKLLFRPGAAALGPQAKRSVCVVSQMLQQGDDWAVTLRVPADQADAKYWETAGDRVAALAGLLESGCSVASQKIMAAAVRPGEGAKDAQTITIAVGPKVLPRVKGSEAPLGSAEKASELTK
jgi:hypothetical protein